MNGENVVRIEAAKDWYKDGNREYMKEVAEITYRSGHRKYADIDSDSNLTACYDVLAVIQEIKPQSEKVERIERGVYQEEIMTKEEAIKILNEIIDEGLLISDNNKCSAINACEMAIKALEKEPCNDCISRQAAIDAVNNLTYPSSLVDVKRKLVDLPPVKPQQPVENWKFYYDHGYTQAKRDLLCEDCISRAEALKHSHIEYDNDGDGHRVVYAEDIEDLPSITPERKMGRWIRFTMTNDLAQCSECGDYVDNAIRCGYNFCPNCGAEMQEVEDERQTEN